MNPSDFEIQTILNEQKKKIAESFKVLVVGSFCSGKSSLINALVGREFLSTSDLPETGVITELVYGEKYRVTLYPKEGSGAKIKALEQPTKEEFGKYCSIDNSVCQEDALTNNRKYERAVVECDIPFLKKGIMLIDTPYMNDYWDDDYITEQYFPKTDAIIYLMSCNRIYTMEDEKLLTRINEYGFRDLIIVYTHFGKIEYNYRRKPQSALEEFCEVARNRVAKHTDLGDKGIHFIDSLDGLDAKINGDEELLARSGVAGLEKFLFHYIAEKENKKDMLRILGELSSIASTLDDERSNELVTKLKSVEARLTDSKLNLAVIGEYSCGKSTFLNALLKKEVLSTDMQPTTAVPTYITWDPPMYSGEDFEITAYDAQNRSYYLNEANQRKKFESYLGVRLPDKPEQLMDAITTNNALAGKILKVYINVSYDSSYKGICLIDTPGVNPGTEGTEEHIHITQKVLREAADSALVMFPADQVYTATFGKFLKENAEHLLKNSIFVITKCDLIKKRDLKKTQESLDEIRDFVAFQLKKLGVDKPVIHCISAGSALNAQYSDEKHKEKDVLWQQRFNATIQEIFSSLSNERNRIVYENVTAAVGTMTNLLTETLQESRKNLDLFFDELERSSPEKMKAECRSIMERYKERLKKQKQKWDGSVSNIIDNAINDRKSRSFQYINNNCDSKEAVSSYLSAFNSYATDTIKAAIENTAKSMQAAFDQIMKDYKEELAECYTKYVQNVSVHSVDSTGRYIFQGAKQTELSVSVNGINNINLLDECVGALGNIFDSDSIGEAFGNIIIAGITIPLAVVLSVFSLFESLDSVKSKAKEQVSSALDATRSPAIDSLKETLDSINDRYMKAVSEMPDKITNKYSSEFDIARRNYQTAKRKTLDEMEQIKTNLIILKKISEQIFWIKYI